MSQNNPLQCEYLGWGALEALRSRPLTENETFIFTPPVNSPGALIRGLMDSARSPELPTKIPPQYSDNDLAAPIVEMVRTLPEQTLQEWSDPSKTAGSIVGAVLRW